MANSANAAIYKNINGVAELFANTGGSAVDKGTKKYTLYSSDPLPSSTTEIMLQWFGPISIISVESENRTGSAISLDGNFSYILSKLSQGDLEGTPKGIYSGDVRVFSSAIILDSRLNITPVDAFMFYGSTYRNWQYRFSSNVQIPIFGSLSMYGVFMNAHIDS